MKVLVTGGASGLGESITRALAAVPGSFVNFTYCNSEQRAASLRHDFSNVHGIRCDFSLDEDVDSLISAIPSLDLDVLVHNAFTGFVEKHFHKLDSRDFENGFRLNILPVIKISQLVLRGFRAKKQGRVVTILTSYLVNRPPVGMSEYVAAKAYLHSLAKSWASENANFEITSNCVSPSLMETNLVRNVDSRVLEAMVREHPLKSLLTPDEAAQAVVYLASPAARHVNGINIVINAGANVI